MSDVHAAPASRRPGPLSKFRVIDITRVRAGPTAVRHFADWGADVIRVEAPAGMPDCPLGALRHNFDFQNLHRNKRCMTLNLREPEALKIFYRLVETADVLFENARPAVKERLGIDYKTLSAINARLVYCSISGFGQDGPYADRAGYDQIAQGMGGLMSVTGEPGHAPMRTGIAIADSCSGHFAAMGAMTALLEREGTGKGQFVTTSLLEAQIAMMDFQAARYLASGDIPLQAGNDHPYITPMGVFETADGHVNIAVASEGQWRSLCAVLGDDDLAKDERFAGAMMRTGNRDDCREAVTTLTRKFPSVELIKKLNAASVPSGPIYNLREVFDDPQVNHLEMAAPTRHPALGDTRLVSQPIKMSGHKLAPFTATPELGEHTHEILKELGIEEEEVEDLREERLI